MPSQARGSTVSWCEASTSGRQVLAPCRLRCLKRPGLAPSCSAVATAASEAGPYTAPTAVLLPERGLQLALAKQLTTRIKQSSGWRELRDLMQDNLHACNYIHVSAALTMLSRLVPRPQLLAPELHKPYNAFCRLLFSSVAGCVPRMRPRELSNVLGAMAKVGVRPGVELLDALCSASRLSLHMFQGQDLGSTAWALARLGYVPSPSWLSAFTVQSEACLPGMDAQALSNLLWAFARWDYAPPREMLRALVGSAAPQLRSCSPQALANLLWGLARQRYRPHAEWMEAYWGAVYGVTVCSSSSSRGGDAPSMSAAELSLVFFAAGKLGVSPYAADRLGQLVCHLGQHVQELTFAGSAYALWGLSHMGTASQQQQQCQQPGGDAVAFFLMGAWFRHTQHILDSFAATDGEQRPVAVDGQALANALFAFYRLESARAAGEGGGAPGSSGTLNGDEGATAGRAAWLRSSVRAATTLMANDAMDARALAVSGLCLSRLGSEDAPVVDDAWRAAFVGAVRIQLGRMNSAEVTNVSRALSRLKQVPSAGLMSELVEHVHSELLRFRPHELASTLLALACLDRALCAQEEQPGSSGQWRALSRIMWAALLQEARIRWVSLPFGSISLRDVRVVQRAALLLRLHHEVAWAEGLIGGSAAGPTA